MSFLILHVTSLRINTKMVLLANPLSVEEIFWLWTVKFSSIIRFLPGNVKNCLHNQGIDASDFTSGNHLKVSLNKKFLCSLEYF